MKDTKIVTVTNEEPKDLWIFLNKSLPLPYKQFLLKHFKHPKFRKELFFLLKQGDKIISMFANRDASIFNCDLNIALFGDVATLPKYRKKGCMKLLVYNMLKRIQEEKDLIINPWSMKRNYKRVYAKLGFSRIKKLKTTYEFYKDVSKGKRFSKISNFHEFRMRDRKTKQRRQIFFTTILYLQYLCLSGIHILQRLPKTCSVEKLEELKENDVEKLNELFIEYCLKRARNFFERDEETWRFIRSYNDIYLIKHDGEKVGYAIGSFLKDQLVIYEIYAKDFGIYFYAVSYFEELARKKGKKEIIIWADTLHRSLAKYGYIPNDITFIVPLDFRGVTVIVRLLKNFFEKINIDCELCLYDSLLDSHIKIGNGDFSIHLTQKDMADLIFGSSVICTLFKARVKPKYKMFNAYIILSKIKKEYGIKDCLRTRFDMY
jgi:GNAT superfamily N-acetyltransferase